jgi:hypothetical protein
MKQVIVAIMVLIPAISFAKVEDFNQMISDNMKAQDQLHADVKNNIDSSRVATQKHEKIVVVEGTGTSYNAHTNKDLLTFKKEQTNYKTSDKTQTDRVAGEISDSN